jgi:hypothetical protein
MHQEGGIGLGTGGDNSRNGVGSFFEGVMTAGYPSDAADDAVQANIVAAGYAGNTNPTGPTNTRPPAPNNSTEDLTPSAAGQAVVHSAGATGCGAHGFSSVYTVDASNGHLQETYLPCMFQNWNTQDLSAQFGTPPVKAGTQPVSIVHCGWTSVYTVDASNGDLQETYLSAIGNPWGTQDLSQKYGTPPTNVTPTAVEHTQGASGSSPGCGFTSVYTVDAGSGDLQETYLPNSGFPGDPWTTQDLSKNYGVPAVAAGTSPVAVVHCGWTSVYYVNTANGLEEAYLPEITYPWSFQSLSVNYGTPAVAANTSPTAVVHSAGDTGGTCGWTSVYTVDAAPGNGGDLEETYLPDQGFPGDNWHPQDLTQHYGVPQVAEGEGASPVALVHMGYTSVYYINTALDLEEAYLPAIYGPWSYQDLTANYGSPPIAQTPIVLLHPDSNGNLDWTSVFTIPGGGHLVETYLSNVGFPGDPWQTQDLSARFGTPPAT